MLPDGLSTFRVAISNAFRLKWRLKPPAAWRRPGLIHLESQENMMYWLLCLLCLDFTLAGSLVSRDGFKFHHGFCGTSVPGDSLKAEHRRLSLMEAEAAVDGSGSRETLTPIEIDTRFHIVSSEAQADLVTDEMIMAQVSLDSD